MPKNSLRENYFFTSESVSMGHPDKVSDQISDAILDSLLAKDNMAGVTSTINLMTDTFFAHLKWMPVIALGYATSIWVHLIVNSRYDGVMP